MADSNAKKLAQLLDANGDVLLDNLDNISVTPTSVSDQDNTSTGSFTVPKGTTAQEPSATDNAGQLRFDTDKGVMTYSDGTTWYKVSAELAVLDSVSGTIYAGLGTDLTLSGSGFLSANLVVNFTQTSDSIDVDVTVTPTTGSSATVSVPSSVYNNVTAGNVVSITVTNSDSSTSNAITETASALPSGGTVTTSGDYRIHTFTSSSSFTVPSGLTVSDVEYLVIAGGGGGGSGNGPPSASGGGGGAGGYRSSVTGESSGGGNSAESKLSLSSGSYTVTIGAGGVGQTDNTGTRGGNSVFGSITSTGGGGGGCGSGYPPLTGGSGGGGDYGGGAAGTSGQGYAGGTGTASPYYGGGGGGAGQTGRAYNTNPGRNGDGGSGVESSIDGTATYRAGGGGAGVYHGNDTGVGLGGAGGGGDGGKQSSGGSNGTVNTGGGGGGGPRSVPFSGGSGVVIVRYDVTQF